MVSRSSADAEYRAMANTTDELIWLKALLLDLGIETPQPIIMHCDNQKAIHIASNSVFHERTKHTEVDSHNICGKVELGIIYLTYTKSSDQLADIFTKVANSKVCNQIQGKLGLLDLGHDPLGPGIHTPFSLSIVFSQVFSILRFLMGWFFMFPILIFSFSMVKLEEEC